MHSSDKLRIAVGFATVATLSTLYYMYVKRRKPSSSHHNSDMRQNKSFRIVEDSVLVRGALDVSVHSELDVSTSGSFTTLGLERPIVLAMVGLPARGKSYLVKMMIRYFSWIGLNPKVFNVGSYRRSQGMQGASSDFFDGGNIEARKTREKLAMVVQDEMYKWIHAGQGASQQRVAIFDATNTTKARRMALMKRSRRENVFLLFVESICNDEKVLRRNYELKLQNEDYKQMDPEAARRDFAARVKAYESQYETIEDDEDNFNISFIKLVNVGQKIITRNCFGYLPSQVSFYLQNVHIQPRKIYLALHAEQAIQRDILKKNNPNNSYGLGESLLTESGREFSLHLAKYIEVQFVRNAKSREDDKFLVLAGTSKLHTETIMHLRMMCPCFTTPLLSELRAGDLHGLSREEIQSKFPEEWAKREQDKLHYRYPGVGGESYFDVIERIRPVIIELERQRRSLLVVTHLAVLRCIYAYFTGTETEKIPYIPMKMHQIIELSPGPFGCMIKLINPAEEVDTM